MEEPHPLSRQKIKRGIGVLSKIRHFVNTKILTQLYYSLIYPFLTYDLSVWDNTYQSSLNSIVILQKKAVRIMTWSSFYEHTSPLFKKLNILKLNDLIFLYNALFMYDFYSGKLPSVFNDFFTKIDKVHQYNTRLASKKSFYIFRQQEHTMENSISAFKE